MEGEIDFKAAVPVWPAGREREMNRFVGFRCVVRRRDGQGLMLRVAASTVYRAFVDGEFLGCGPARAAHGYFRVDEWPIERLCRGGDRNLLAIEVAGYNINSYYTLDQPAFLLAEVLDPASGEVLAATGDAIGSFTAHLLDDHVQKVERYSAARTFSEVLRLRTDWDDWRRRIEFDSESPGRITPSPIPMGEGGSEGSSRHPRNCHSMKNPHPSPLLEYREREQVSSRITTLPPVKLLARRVPYPDFAVKSISQRIAGGRIERLEPAELHRDWTLTAIGPHLKGFTEPELEIVPSLELQKLRCIPDGSAEPLVAGRYETFDLGSNLTGFIRLHFRCDTPIRLAVVFDEILAPGGDVSFNRLRCNNVIWIDAEPGDHDVETFEPYTMRYIKLMCLDGAGCRIDRLELRRFEHPPPPRARSEHDDPELVRIFDAGVSTFRQNAVDLPMDCPSRERSAWLCDSFFTCRAAFDLTASTAIERNFLENYLLPERFEHLPEGMVAMNYPADHPNGKFIPNWALWLVLQLEEYLRRSRDRAMIDGYRRRVEGIFSYLARFLNESGLLEKLDGWIFVEWSRANDFVQDVNYPTNMLYAAALDAGARLYARPDWSAAAGRTRAAIGAQSFDGAFFVDNSVRNAGQLRPTRNRTEVCQYHAFYFDIATPDSHPQLWRWLCEDFGPARAQTNAFPEIHPANALMGYTLRLELLDRFGRHRQLLDEIKAYFLPMTDVTATLWEHGSAAASCCHGFGAHVCRWIRRAAHVLASTGAGG